MVSGRMTDSNWSTGVNLEGINALSLKPGKSSAILPMSTPRFSFSTTAEEVATALANEITGKNVLITGTSMNGIGFETARVIAKHANLVIITGYNEERLKLSEDALKRENPAANIRTLVLDLASLAAVRKGAAEVNTYSEPIHVLIHNAAAAIGPFNVTVDGFESQIATAHIGPFLFTKLILPKLLAAGAPTPTYIPRVVYLSSEAHAFGNGVNLEAIGKPNEETYQSMMAYCEAKSANVLMGVEISRRSGGRVNGYSVHPGAIFTNIMQKEESLVDYQHFEILDKDGQPNPERFAWKTIPQGAATTIVAAFDPGLNDIPGTYLVDCNAANDKAAAHSLDLNHAQKLWDVTEEIVGEKFEF
ncbi:short-chain dehydrogenase/reductase family protein [Favolaschia claudopus]|uniref:Short-chain dehydrogenase/reductase family protein n=1 Tax=Favolaschia claudopus TaxID=2862362 RepID=A0AAW0CMQ1_9AGAR